LNNPGIDVSLSVASMNSLNIHLFNIRAVSIDDIRRVCTVLGLIFYTPELGWQAALRDTNITKASTMRAAVASVVVEREEKEEEDAMEAYYSSEDQTWVPDNFMTRGLADEYFIENKVKICLSACVFKSPFSDEYLFRNGTLLVYKLEDGTMVTEQEAEEKEIDLKGIESEYVDLDDYMSKVEKITQKDLLTQLKEYNFSDSQINRFKDTVSLRGGFRSDLRTFFGENRNETIGGLIKVLIYFSYKESEKNEFGKVKRKNRREVLDNSESTVNEFIEKIKINNLSTSTLELMFELVDAQISNLISDKNFLAQIIILKTNS
jgi:hypothetical protein